MTIDIAEYISKIECLMGVIIDRAKESGISNQVFVEDQRNILLPGAFAAAHKLQEEIYNEVVNKEGKSYSPSNEMKLLAFAVIWSAWSAWVFMAKSEDPNRSKESRELAEAVSKYVETMIVNAIKCGQNIGKGNGGPEGRKEPINLVTNSTES